MRNSIRLVSTLAFGAILAACGANAAPVDEALARDLERIGGSSLELAPAGQATEVISAVEQTPRAQAATPAPAPTRTRVAQNAPRPRQQKVRTPTPAPRAIESAPAPAAAPEPVEVESEGAVELPRPSSPPQGAGAPPPGGWRNVNDVIRNSRIPINP